MCACSVMSLWDPMDCSSLGSSVHGIFQARIREWVAISYPRGSSRPWDQTRIFCVSISVFTTWYCINNMLPETRVLKKCVYLISLLKALGLSGLLPTKILVNSGATEDRRPRSNVRAYKLFTTPGENKHWNNSLISAKDEKHNYREADRVL